MAGKPIIGIDASRALSAAPTGTEGYSYHLIRALLSQLDGPFLDARYQTRLYFRSAPEPEAFPGAAIRIIPFPRLWTHLRLSWEMAHRAPDLLFVPAHVLPLVRPKRTLVTIHDLGYRYFPEAHPRKQRLYLDWSTRWNARVADHILADSCATRGALVQAYGIDSAKITVAYPGYDSDLAPVRDADALAAVRARYAIPGPYILFMGRLQPRKNLARLIEAFAHLASERPDLSLLLAGPAGWLAEPIHARVRELGLEARVLFPGYVAETDKAALISGAQVFAYPSLYEGFGFPVLEAQACGVPLLASTTSSLPEVVGDGGLLVDPLDTSAIAAGLVRLLDDVDLRHDLIARGAANLRRFSWDATAHTVLTIIENLLSLPSIRSLSFS
ncbi:MAG: glycosyltransferase family 4 protein [Anaerolineae bacterium]|nr:glycosyltransferase family 4 protein [Anaerolineae bacterium]